MCLRTFAWKNIIVIVFVCIHNCLHVQYAIFNACITVGKSEHVHEFENLRMQESALPAAGGKVGQNADRRNSHRQEIEGNWNFEIRKV